MLELVIWDVQHGSSAYLKTPNGKHIAIDLGTGNLSDDENAFSPLLHLKNKYNVEQLDEVIITHPHTDHIDDIMNFDILSAKTLTRPNHLSKEDIIKANPSSDKKRIEKYIEISNRYCFPVSDYTDPNRPENNGGVNIEIFIPKKSSTNNINNHSIVTIIEYLGVKIIIPGDNESTSWRELLNDPLFVNAIKNTKIFVASHHGRESGYCSELFNHFSPELVIISDGPYGDTSVTDKYRKVATGSIVYKRSENERIPYARFCLTTRNDGTIVVKVFEYDYRITIE